MTTLENLQAELANHQATLLAASAAGAKPSYGNGPRNVQWTPELQRIQARVTELIELIARLQPDEFDTPVRAL